MTHTHDDHESEQLLDAAIAAARRGPSASDTERAVAAARAAVRTAASGEACSLLRPDLPALVRGELAPARAELVSTHARECLPCRREWLALTGVAASGPVVTPAPTRIHRFMVRAGLGFAAAAALFAGVVAWQARPGAPAARVATLEGVLLSDGVTPLAVGDAVPAGRPVRTAKGSRAVIELLDGTRVEMNERAELEVRAAHGRKGELSVELGRGDIIVAAAQRRERNLLVRTDEFTVAVKGTVFAVGHGLKGSRVGVLEGEVHVTEPGEVDPTVLGPGGQTATDPGLAQEPLEDQVAWSLSHARWSAVIAEIEGAAAQVESERIPPVVRHHSAALDAMPASTVFFAAVPNGGGMTRLVELVSERVAANPQLSAWWAGQIQPRDSDDMSFASVLQALSTLTSALGEEFVLAMVLEPSGADGAPGLPVPVAIAPVRDANALHDFLASLPRPKGSAAPELLSLEQLAAVDATGPAGSRPGPRLVLHEGHVVATHSLAVAKALASRLGDPAAKVATTPFLATLHEQYRQGTEFLLAADVAGIVSRAGAAVAHEGGAHDATGYKRIVSILGIDGIEHFVLTAGAENPGEAVLSFREARKGMAAWLDEPAPMGSLEFIGAQAHLVSAAVLKDPAVLLQDVEAAVGSDELSRSLERFDQETGIDLRDDVAAALGGEIAFAIDGPLLPTPAWRLVVEAPQEAKLQSAIETLVERGRQWSQATGPAAGTDGAKEWSLQEVATAEGPVYVLVAGGFEMAHAYRDGYFVAAPSQAMLESTLRVQRLGGSIVQSAKFRELLPDGDEHVSMLSYQDLGNALSGLAGMANAAGISPESLPVGAMGGACLVHARASEREILFGVAAPGSGPGAQLAGLVRHLLAQAVASKLVESAGPPVGYDAPAAR